VGGKKKYINIFGSFTEPFNCELLNPTGRPPDYNTVLDTFSYQTL